MPEITFDPKDGIMPIKKVELPQPNNINKFYQSIPTYQGIGRLFPNDSMFDEGIEETDLSDINRYRSEQQPWYAQASGTIVQAANEAVFGTIQSLAALGDIESYKALLNNSSKSDEDFHNAVYDWAKNIKESINEEIPIYSSDRFDSGWFWKNLGQTVGSAASFYIPGMGAAKLLGKLGEAIKLGTTASGTLQTLGGAAVMRHAENFQEAANVYDLTFESAKKQGLSDEEASSIAGEAAAHDYKLNSANYAFDVLQLGAILRPKLPSFLKGLDRQPYEVLKAANLLPDSKLGRFSKWIVDPAKGIMEAGSEGLEEVVNQISQYESQRLADINSGKIQDDNSTFFDRLPKYLGEAETIDSFIWGTVGGAAFKGLGLITGQDKNKKITQNKLAELYSRNETLKAYSDQIANVVNGNQISDESGKVIRDYSTYSDELKQSTIETLNNDLAFNLGLNASRVGNTDLLIKQLSQPEFQEQLISSGVTTKEDIQNKIPEIKKQIELANYLYNKYTNRFFETPVEETVKSRLVEQSISFEKQIADNNSEIDKLRKENSRILSEDPIIKANSYNPEFNQSISKAALRIAKVQVQNQIDEIKKDTEIKSDLQTVLAKLDQKEKQIPEIDVDEVTFSNFNLVNNQAQQELYQQFNTIINSKINDLASKENIESTKAKVASDKKKAKEFVVNNKATSDNQNKQNRVNNTDANLKAKQIAQVAYKIVNRKDPNEKLTLEEQQIYDNNSEAVEQLINDIHNARTEQGIPLEPIPIIVTEPEIQEHSTETNTGYIDNTYYDNKKDNEVIQGINKAEEQLKKDQGSKITDTDGNIIIEGDKISDGYQALAHLSREYELVKTPQGKKLYQYASDELIDKMDRIILSTEKMNPGEEVELFVNENYTGDFYDPSIIDDNKAVISWQSYLDNLKQKYGENYKISDEYIDNVPIGVRYNNQELVSTYYHQNSWINENKVASEDIEEDRKNNKTIREYVVKNNTFKTNITYKGNGVLFRIKDYIPLNKATEDPNPTIAVVDKDQTFKLAKGSAEASYFQEQTINVKDLNPGTTVLLTEVNKGKYLAIPVKNSQISISKYFKEIKDSITQAITIYLDNDKTNKFALDVLKAMKLDMTSIEGLESYITKFVNNYNTNKQDLQVLQKSGALPVTTDVTIFNINKGNIAFKNFGTVYYVAKNLQVKRELFFQQLDKALDKLYLGTNIDSLAKNESILLSGIEQPIDYKTFLMESLSSNIKGFKVDEVGLERVPIYSYTIQKVVRLDFSEIVGEEVKTLEVKEDIAKLQKEYNSLQKLIELGNDNPTNIEYLKELEEKLRTTKTVEEFTSNEPQLTISFQIEDFSELPDIYDEGIKYQFKSIEILQSDRAKQIFDKGNKNNWSLDKILTELAIPKEQKQLLLDIGSKDREQLILELTSKYSYSIEVNTAKGVGEAFTNRFGEQDAVVPIDWIPEDDNKVNSSYYSNLTVPGGTNYTENEISTPLITPSIKGHAQFSTDNGIGWFRSDDRSKTVDINTEEYYDEDYNRISKDEYIKRYGDKVANNTPTKTRRILEVQSDLFQKGRDNNRLVGEKNNYDTTEKQLDSDKLEFEEAKLNGDKVLDGNFSAVYAYNNTLYTHFKTINEYKKQKNTAKEEDINSTQNQFLQLLNKDNNWVTFFIKSIIQDSSKKGYEKVLFPKGETAAKIEGHETIANEIEKYNKLIEDEKIAAQNAKTSIKYIASNDIFGYGTEEENEFKTKAEAENFINTKGKDWFVREEHINKESIVNFHEDKIKQFEQKKSELKSQGIEKLKPIEAFYEIKVGNILEKQFGKDNVKTITDEYGNEWREIDLLNKEIERSTSTISLLPDLDIAQVSLLQKYAENISVPGLDIHKQIQLVNTLTNSVIETIQRVKDKDVKTLIIYNTWKEGLEKNRTILKDWLDIEENKTHSKYTGFQKMFNSIDSALKGWNTILRQAEQKVANIVNKRIDPDQPLDLQEIQDSERFDFDKSADEKNPEDGVSARVKILLAGIEDIDKEGKSKKNWLGEAELVDHRLVYNTFQQWTTDLLRPTFNDMLTSIKAHENEFNWVPNAIKKLESISDQDQKAFVNDMLNNYTKFIKVMWDMKESKGGFRVNLQYPSKLSSVDTLLNKWKANFINSNLVQLTEGNYTFNKELADKVVAEFRVLQKQTSISRDELKNWLNNFNIELSDNTWRDLENGYFRISTKRVSFKNLLLNSYSPFVVLADSIDRLSENREIEDANPFDNTAVEKLAQFEAKHSDNLYSQMVRTASKTIYPFNKNTFVSNRILDLVKGNKIEELKVLPYNRNAYWLNEGKDIFKANITLASADLEVLRKHGDRTSSDNELHNLSDSDYELVNMALIHASQEDKSGGNNRIISLLYPTQSDKTKAVIVNGIPAFKIGFDTEGNIELETLNRIYNQLVLPEIERIIHFQKLVDSKTPINISGLAEGWNKFYFIPTLNILEDIFTEGKLNTNIQTEDLKIKIIKKLDEVIQQLRDEKLNNWKSYEIIDQESRPIYIDNKFIKENIKGIQSENYIAISKALASDMVIQNLVGNANIAMTMIGDFANAYKSKSTDPIQQIKDTFNNIGKRLASDIAPGSETEDNNTGTYKQAFIDDRALDSLNLGQYKFIIGEEESKEYTSKGILKEGTNAQEFTTVSEQLTRYYYEGVIDKDFYQTAIDEIKKQIEINNHDYTDKVKKALIKVNPDYLDSYNKLILQVEKPVYVDNKIDPILQHEVRYYIKSSAYSLTPELTKGTDLDNIRIAMEKQGVSRLAFSSAVKLGNFKNPITLWNSDGTIKTSDQIDFTNSSVLLNRSGFRIQQIIPYDETKAEINRVSQASKNLFLNLHNVEGFEYQGKIYKGSELNDIYQSFYKQIFDIQKQDFTEEIGYDLKTDRFINTEESINKIKKIILDEANRRNYPINDIEGIQLDKSLKLLAFSSSSQKLESLLNSIVQNRVLKILHSGHSYVLSTEEGYQRKLEGIKNSGIVYTDSWSGELKPQRIVKKKLYNETGTEELVDNKYYKENQNDCLVLPAQALIPFPYKDNEGKSLDINDFINSETGKIDNKKLPKELRYTFGMRIPNSKLDSQSYIEAVGFIPKSSGDVMIATRDYLVQMGSDFDVDKLYNYMYSTYYDNQSGKLKRFTAKIKQKEEIDELFKEEVIKPSSKKKDLLNSILDIHIAIHSNTSPEVQSQIFSPLGTWEFETIAKKIESYQKETRDFVGIADQYQKNVRLGNASDKLLVGIFANLNVFNAVAQGKDLKMVLGFTKEGKEIPFILNFGDKTSKGDLSGEYTIGDKKTFKSDIITALLQSAVDGAKLQILGKFNHNAQTSKIVNLLAQLGFKEEVALFTSQPIIKELIDKVKSGMSSTKPFTPDLTNESIKELRNKIINTIPEFSQEAFDNKYGYGKALSIDNMWSTIKDGETNPEYKFIQLAALDQYAYLLPQADKLTSVMAAINTDSKGLSKNLLESIIKYDNVLKYVLFGRTTIVNVERLLENTINGEASDILKLNNNIWRQVLPYDSIGVQKYFNTILDILGKQELSIDKKADLQRQIFNEFKSYLFSKKELGLADQDIQTERQRLFFGENSLANTISKLQKEEQWKNHPFIGKLYYELNKNGLPSIVKINAAQEDVVEQSTIMGAYDLLIRDKKIEGTTYTTRTLMQDLTLAAYLSGGIQQAQQYLKYIPSAYLHTIPFADNLNKMIEKFDDMEFMQIPNENANIWELPSFVIQYFQHNSDRIRRITADEKGNIQGVKRLETKNKILEKFALTDTDLIDSLPIFLTVNATGRKRGLSRNHLYIHQGEMLEDKPVFTRIDNLGYTGFKEYNGNLPNDALAKSTIIDNNTDNIIQTTYTENEERGFSRIETNPLMGRTPIEIIELRSGGKEVISDILQNIVAEETINPYYKIISNVLNENLDNLSELNLTTEVVRGAGFYEGTKVNINPEANRNQTLNGIVRTLLHELVHSQTSGSIEDFLAGKTKKFTKEQLVALTRLKNLWIKYKEIITNKEGEKYKSFEEAYAKYLFEVDYNVNAKLHTTQETVSKYYPLKDMKEFVSMTLTDENFQKVLNEIPFDDNKTWLQKIIEEITNLLGKLLGIDINKGSALEVALHDILNLLNTNTRTVVAVKSVSSGFQGYRGGFENKGKGTPEGDGKDKAMRKVADSAIGEMIGGRRASSTATTMQTFMDEEWNYYPKEQDTVTSMSSNIKVVMLARNGELKGKALTEQTKLYINRAKEGGAEFVVGDMPNVDSQFIDYLQEIDAKFTVYHTREKSRIIVKETTEVSELPEVATPIIQDRPKFQLVIDNLKQQQSKIYKIIASKTIDLKKVSGEEKINIKRVLKALNRQIEEIDLQIDRISKLTSVESILDHANNQLKDISNRLNQKTITENDMLYARNTINLWLEAGDFSSGNIFFNDDEIEASKNEDSDLFKIRRDFVLLRDYASQLSNTWIKLREQYINNWLQTDYGKEFKVSVEDVIKDIGLGKSFLLDISKDDYILVQAMYDWNAKASLETSRDAHKVMTGIKEIFEQVHKRYKKDQLYEMFSQTQSNTDKRKTGDLVFRYSQKYFDWKGNLWGQLKGKLKLANSIDDSNKRKAYIAKQWQEFNTEFKKNNLVIDIRKLLPDSELYSKTFSTKEIEQHKQELIFNLGIKGYEKQLERAKEKLEKYKLDREAELFDLTQRYSEDSAKVMLELQVWDYENSPYLYAEQWEEGFKQVINGRYISTNGYNSEIVPKRIVEGVDQGYYDSKFETIEKDSELLAVYDYLLSTIQELNGYFPGDIQGELQVNTLPKFEKGILESFSEGEMINGLKGILDSFKELQRESIGSPIESTTSTDVYGEKIKGINTYWIQPNTKRIQDYVERQEIIYRQSNPKVTGEQLYKLKKEWTKDIKDIIARESTTDLEKTIKLYSLAAISYKHKAKIEDAMTLSNSFIKDLVKSKQNLSGESLKDQFGKKRTSDKPAENLEKQLDHFMDVFYGDKTQAIELTTKQKVYTDSELKIKKEIEETLAKLDPEVEENRVDIARLNKQLKDLGGYRTGGKLLDMMNQWVRLLGLAWNPFSSINNASIGYMCNITEASGGRVFNTEQLYKGYWEFLHNSGKTNAIMEKNSILIEIQSEISEKHKSTKWFEPFGLQHKTELLNQSPVMVAILLNRKVELGGKQISMYEAYDKEGKLKEGVKFPDENYEFKTFQLIKETIKDIHGNYDKDAPIRANKFILGRSLLVFRKWMINSFYNRLGTEHFNLAKEMTDKGRWLSYGSYFKEYGVLLGTRDIALNLIKKLTFGLIKTNFDSKLNEVDAANMRKNLTELMFLGTVTALALMLKATSDDDEDKTKYLCFFWINQLMRMQTDVMFYVDPQQFKTILRDPIPFMVLVNNTQKAIGRGINLVTGGEDLYEQGAHKDQSKAVVAFKKIIPGANLMNRFESMYSQIFSKSVLLQSVGDEENK